MNKKPNIDLPRELAARTGISRLKCADVLEALTDLIHESCWQGNRVKIDRIGTFSTRVSKPSYRALSVRPGKWTLRFEASDELLNLIKSKPMPEDKEDKNDESNKVLRWIDSVDWSEFDSEYGFNDNESDDEFEDEFEFDDEL